MVEQKAGLNNTAKVKRISFITLLFCNFFLSTFPFAQELIKNGDFSNDLENWNNIGTFGDAKAEGKVAEGKYSIKIDAAGAEPWHIQFTQGKLILEKDYAYELSFNSHAAGNREIMVKVGQSAGDYDSYIGEKDLKFKITKADSQYKKLFVMKAESDSNARIEFNLGTSDVDIWLDNISLKKVAETRIFINAPNGGEVWTSGLKKDIKWFNTGPLEKVVLEYSADGTKWENIAANIENKGTYLWTVPATKTKTALIRVRGAAPGAPVAISQAPFEITDVINPLDLEKLENGDFSAETSQWNLGAYGGAEAMGKAQDGIYQIDIAKASTEAWHVQFTQGGFTLDKGVEYTFKFDAYAEAARSILVNVGMSHNPYIAYIDSADGEISLSDTPQTFTIKFIMDNPTDTDARIEFNCGLNDINVFIDNVSLRADPVSLPAKSKFTDNQVLRLLAPGYIFLLEFPKSAAQIGLYNLVGAHLQSLVVRNGTAIWNGKDKMGRKLQGPIIAKPNNGNGGKKLYIK